MSRAISLDLSALSPSEYEAYNSWADEVNGLMQGRNARFGEIMAFIRQRVAVDREDEIMAFFTPEQQQNLGLGQFLAIVRLIAHARSCSTLCRDHVFIQTRPLVLQPCSLPVSASNPFFNSSPAGFPNPSEPPASPPSRARPIKIDTHSEQVISNVILEKNPFKRSAKAESPSSVVSPPLPPRPSVKSKPSDPPPPKHLSQQTTTRRPSAVRPHSEVIIASSSGTSSSKPARPAPAPKPKLVSSTHIGPATNLRNSNPNSPQLLVATTSINALLTPDVTGASQKSKSETSSSLSAPVPPTAKSKGKRTAKEIRAEIESALDEGEEEVDLRTGYHVPASQQEPLGLGRSKTVTARSYREKPPPPPRRYSSQSSHAKNVFQMINSAEQNATVAHPGPYTQETIRTTKYPLPTPRSASAAQPPKTFRQPSASNHGRAASVSSITSAPTLTNWSAQAQAGSTKALEFLNRSRDISQEWLEKTRASMSAKREDKVGLMQRELRDDESETAVDLYDDQEGPFNDEEGVDWKKERERMRSEKEEGWTPL